MAFTKGNTNRECYYFWVGWWGFDGWKRTKSRLRRKKTTPMAKMVHRVYQGWCVPTYGDLPQPTLYEAHLYGCAGSKLRFKLRLSLACPQYAISDGEFAPRGNLINS